MSQSPPTVADTAALPGDAPRPGPDSSAASALDDFHPASRAWFEQQFGQPSQAQAEAWPQIRAGRHTLIAAPTGSGKTLAAFYAAIDALLQRGVANTLSAGVQIVYVSPLKALSNDIRKNLEQPLDGIAEQLHLQGLAPVDIRIAVRTGDTPASERARMAKKPPHILVTTPESLYLLLTSASGRAMLATARSLIVDEIHALLGDKRGSHLALSMERLQQLIRAQGGGALQRIGLSATQKPIQLVANYLVGHARESLPQCETGCETGGDKRDCIDGAAQAAASSADRAWPIADCAIVDSGFRRELDIRIEVPSSPLSALMSNEVWEELYARLVDLITSHETTLVFVNTRRLSERLALALAERLGDDVVCSHHGSMSKDHRHNAEQRLKAGSLKVLVATASMELGIDVGSVDLVVQFSSPKSIATFLQRVGRSGHSIHGTPKGILFPLTRDDLIEASALVHSIRRGELDAIVMPEKPLDILAQQIVAEVSAQVHDMGRESPAAPKSAGRKRGKGSTDGNGARSDEDSWPLDQDDGRPEQVDSLVESPAESPLESLAESPAENRQEGLTDSKSTVFTPLAQALAEMRSKQSRTPSISVTPAKPETRSAALAAARAGLGLRPKLTEHAPAADAQTDDASHEPPAAIAAGDSQSAILVPSTGSHTSGNYQESTNEIQGSQPAEQPHYGAVRAAQAHAEHDAEAAAKNTAEAAAEYTAEYTAEDDTLPLDSWGVDELFGLVTRAFPYRDLSFEEFEDTLRMVADGYTSRRGKRGALLHYDAINRRVRPRRGANLISLTNGGAIPDMFDYQVVLDPEDTVVGSLNEDFALDSLPGDIFTLGTHAWQILRVDGLKVRVRDAQGQQPTVPFWFGEGPGRTLELSTAVSSFRQRIGELILDESADAATRWCVDSVGMPGAAATQVVDYLQAGMNALGAMPTRETIVMERFFDEVGDMHVVIHSPFGSRINRGWGLALRKRFCKSFNFELQAAANEDSIVISLGSVHSFPLDEVFRYLQSTTVRDVLVQALLDSPMFEVRWRWNATRSLAIQRNRSGKRVPPQFQRMDAEDLIAHVFPDQIACAENLTGRRDVPEHPLVDQTIHDCLTEAMDIDALIALIGQIERQELTLIAKDLREPSPFAQEIINARPYAFLDDAPAEERRTNAIKNRSWADPAEARDYSLLDAEAIRRVREEAWPLVHNAEELHDALQTLGYLTAPDFAAHGYERWRDSLVAQGRLMQLAGHPQALLFAAEDLPRFKALFPRESAELALPAFLAGTKLDEDEALRELVRARLEGLGPVTSQRLAAELLLPTKRIEAALLALEVEGFVFQGRFSPASETTGDETEWCERRLLQRIHRYTIDTHRKAIKPVSLQAYTLFLFAEHGLQPVHESVIERLPAAQAQRRDAGTMQVRSRSLQAADGPVADDEDGSGIHAVSAASSEPGLDGQTQLQRSLAMLDGLSAPAANWEADLYPARVADYDPNWLDVLCISGRVTWGRYVQPSASQRALHRGRSGPVKTTPIAIMSRANLDIWQALARAQSRSAAEAAKKTRFRPGAARASSGAGDVRGRGEAAQHGAKARDAESASLAALTPLAARIEADLAQNGASFFDQILSRTRLLKAQLEEGLAELVGAGRVSSDSFTGLRALLTPSKKTSGHRRRGRSPMFGIEDAGRWSLLETFRDARDDDAEPSQGEEAAQGERYRLSANTGWQVLDDDQLERLVSLYLTRWGVLFRGILERELLAPPWRVMLRVLRRMELRGTVRGGRFVAGVGGEQFAFHETIDGLRRTAKGLPEADGGGAATAESVPRGLGARPERQGRRLPRYHSLAASDPLNLLNLLLPTRKLAKLLNNRVLFEDGIPIAVVDAGEIKFLRDIKPEDKWALQQALVQKHFPPRLRSYLGKGKLGKGKATLS